MKCSLLTLSIFIDGELPEQRRSEVDAHLVGCPRCTAGAVTLREEKARVGQLARVHVDPASAQSMLEQVGISVDPVSQPFAAPPLPAAAPSPASEQLPWQSGLRSPALPWTPRRPDPSPPAIEEPAVSAASSDVQPDLPLDGVSTSHLSWQHAVAAGVREEVIPVPVPSDSWEADLPPPVETPLEIDEPWDVGHAVTDPMQAPVAASTELTQAPLPPPPPPVAPLSAAAPTRHAAASGPGAVWTRVRDAVAVRLALSRGADAAEDSLQIVSGAPTRPAAKLVPPPVASGAVAASPGAPPAATAAASVDQDVELNGVARPVPAPVSVGSVASVDRPPVVAGRPPGHWRGDGAGRDSSPPRDSASWNAFAASSFPLENDATAEPQGKAPRPLGRHSRAVARERTPLAARMGRAMATAGAGLRVPITAAMAATKRTVSGISISSPNNRLFAAVAGVGLLFVGVLLVGHATSRPAPAAAPRPAPTAVATHPTQSAPAVSTAAPAPSVAAAQTFGSGARGFQVIRLRYGEQATYMRVVFDLTSVSGQAGGSPKVAVSFTDPRTMLVTFTGALSAGSWRPPPAGNVISSVTLVSSGSQQSVYRFALAHSVTTTGFYLAAPTRFVLDLH